MGVNVGPVVFEGGDYFGRTVNIAARVTDYARPREVLVTEVVVRSVASKDIAFDEIGNVSLKGVPDPVKVWRARAASS
jgi:adenylate cyclase